MADACGRAFDEALLSGYLDQALVQGDEQQVRLHVEDCVSCRALLEELASVRDATISSTFDTPRDDEWSEAPRTATSRLLRGIGWRLVAAWMVALVAFGLWETWQETANLFERLLLVGGVSGIGLLLLSAVLDRKHAMKTDRYRGVRK